MSASSKPGFHLFATAVGLCGIAWTDAGIAGAALPDRTPERTAALLARRSGGTAAAPPPQVAAVAARIARLVAGEDVEFADVALDFRDAPTFQREVLALTRAIPRGATRTYGALAADLGDPLLARDVGQALGSNPIPIIVPCHRVLGADEKLVGFSAPGGLATKRKLLAIEGVFPGGGPTLFDHFGVATA